MRLKGTKGEREFTLASNPVKPLPSSFWSHALNEPNEEAIRMQTALSPFAAKARQRNRLAAIGQLIFTIVCLKLLRHAES